MKWPFFLLLLLLLLEITAFDLARRENVFIMFYVLLLSSSLHSLFILYTAKPKYGERETGYIFAILIVDALSCHPLEKSFQEKCVLSQWNWKIKLFSIQQCVMLPQEGSIAPFLNRSTRLSADALLLKHITLLNWPVLINFSSLRCFYFSVNCHIDGSDMSINMHWTFY